MTVPSVYPLKSISSVPGSAGYAKVHSLGRKPDKDLIEPVVSGCVEEVFDVRSRQAV